MHSEYHIEGVWGVMMNAFLIGIIIGYLVIAWQFNRARAGYEEADNRDHTKDRAARACGQLIAIFVACALTGYLPRLINFPNAFFVASHGVLFLATWRYVFARNAAVIATALAHG